VQIFVLTNGDNVRIFFSVAFFAVADIFVICLPVDKEFNMQVHIMLTYRMIRVKPFLNRKFVAYFIEHEAY
jgi:hypothetical protein